MITVAPQSATCGAHALEHAPPTVLPFSTRCRKYSCGDLLAARAYHRSRLLLQHKLAMMADEERPQSPTEHVTTSVELLRFAKATSTEQQADKNCSDPSDVLAASILRRRPNAPRPLSNRPQSLFDAARASQRVDRASAHGTIARRESGVAHAARTDLVEGPTFMLLKMAAQEADVGEAPATVHGQPDVGGEQHARSPPRAVPALIVPSTPDLLKRLIEERRWAPRIADAATEWGASSRCQGAVAAAAAGRMPRRPVSAQERHPQVVAFKEKMRPLSAMSARAAENLLRS